MCADCVNRTPSGAGEPREPEARPLPRETAGFWRVRRCQARHRDTEPLTAAEHLELLATAEYLAPASGRIA